ncbi:hypothetical protein [Pontibacter anaerobius]|uniref:Uncharacterized protein n=1 Tax=Pontibacter anaerobius TaxID=2993940 RepID=A0ABT3RCZ4_9BACT|nr:hypothetical protein [Pontibacter anaerobius]MCX2739150.1 hypothetical protein [Pontibacter anaerobius]
MRPKLTSLFLIFLILASACRKDSPKPDCVPYQPSAQLDIYSYPVLPGTPEWAKLQTGEEMYAVTQLPDSVMQAISTEGLVETCYTYPLRLNMTAWPTYQLGVESIMGIFNGFQELSRRSDASAALLARYEHMNPACYSGLTSETEVGRYTLDYALFEAVLAQEVFLFQFSAEQKNRLLKHALNNYAEKKKHPDIYSIFNLKSNAIILARLMFLEKYPPFMKSIQQDDFLRVFVESIELQGRVETIDTVVKHAKSFK